ncbi:MBL fold metallo-hydrolase [Pendulispora brunnea]|uniref:MBL fold metallo-hydrolase n=1 Tax=Pendulispora brunnea TaxID=2905690 RepID=A0ABZ2KJV8_9BACT
MMNPRAHWAMLLGAWAVSGCASAEPAPKGDGDGGALEIRHIRSATVLLTSKKAGRDDIRILVDPILADQGTEPPIEYSNDLPNPRIALPIDKNQLVKSVHAILLTHYHSDHFDGEAERILPKDILIFCQPYDEGQLRKKGFVNLRVVRDVVHWEGLTVSRYRASHYHGATGAPPFGESSSFFVQNNTDGVFFTGDAILDDQLTKSLHAAQPKTVVANTGECQFSKENPLLAPGATMTLTAAELKEMSRTLPHSKIVAVHMDAINHCQLTKRALRSYIENEKLGDHILVPNEGDTVLLR